MRSNRPPRRDAVPHRRLARVLAWRRQDASRTPTSSPPATAWCMAASFTTRRWWSTDEVLRGARSARAARAAAPAAQHRGHPGRARRMAARRAGRLLRHRVPPRPSVRQRRVRPAAQLLRPGRAALRLSRPVLRIHHRTAARDRAAASPPAASSSRISATAPRCARSATAIRSPARWASRRSTDCRWAPAAASSIPASCFI